MSHGEKRSEMCPQFCPEVIENFAVKWVRMFVLFLVMQRKI
jgi:hypothetical protein